MAYISQITDLSGSTHQIKPYTSSLSGVNLNSVTGTGFYKVSNCSSSKYDNATLVVSESASGCSQIETDISTGAIAVRTYNGSIWTTWKELSTTLIATYDSLGNVTITPMDAVADADNTSY